MKEGMALIRAGHEVHLVVERLAQFYERFTSVCVYADVEQLYEAIRIHKDADVFHAHNEPSWFVTVVKDQGIDVPVILDCHDSNLIRRTPEEVDEERKENAEASRVSVDERNNFQLADALIFPCEPMRQQVQKEFKCLQPSLVLPSYVPVGFYRIDFDAWMGGLVYEGRIDIPEELPGKWRGLFRYSDYLDLAQKCRDIKMDFHIYSPRENKDVRKRYDEVCYLHPPQRYDRLIKRIGGHDWGLVGNLHPHTEWKNALPNKLFEYVAGCCPVVALHADESARFIQKWDIGIVVESLDELASRWKEHREKRKNVIRRRMEFTMDAHIDSLVTFYDGVRDAYYA